MTAGERLKARLADAIADICILEELLEAKQSLIDHLEARVAELEGETAEPSTRVQE